MTPNRSIALVVIVILLFLVPTIKHDVLSASYISLPAAPPLAGVVSQALGTGGTNPLPVEGKDYTISTQYFNNKSWAVGLIKPLNNSLNASTIVLEQKQGTYQVVVGPASAAPSSQLQSLPIVVGDYVRAHMAVYQPVPGSN